MTASTSNTSRPPRHPDLHLIVAPASDEEAINQALKNSDQFPVLAWRLAANRVRRVTDHELDTVMSQALREGQAVTVWHGNDAWNAHDLFLRLGDDYQSLSAHLRWAKLSPRVHPSATSAWSNLAEQLGTPDDADLRLWLQTDRQELPRWTLSEDLNAQGRNAFHNWVVQHLGPSLDAWDAGEQSVVPVGTTINSPTDAADGKPVIDWPWSGEHEWEASAWIKEEKAQHVGSGGTPANEAQFALRAASHQADTGQTETWSAVMHPVSAVDQWATDSIADRRPVRRKLASTLAPLAQEVKVQLTRPGHNPLAPYTLEFSPPEHPNATDQGRRWCLWLHPSRRLPLALPFQLTSGQSLVKLEWPSASRPDENLEPDNGLWDEICQGGVSLELI